MTEMAPPSRSGHVPNVADTRSRFASVATSWLALDFAIVSGTSLAFGLVRLGTPSIWVDESFTARAAHSSYTSYIEGYHWLYYSIVRPWTAVAGTSEWALRFPSVVGAMIASALVVVLGRKLFDRWTKFERRRVVRRGGASAAGSRCAESA